MKRNQNFDYTFLQLCIGITLSCKNKRHEIVTSTLILRLTIDSIKAQ